MHGWVHCNYAVHNSDLVISIGMRMDDRACGKFAGFAPQAKIVHIDIDPAEIGKNVRVDVPIVGDVARVLSKLEPEIQADALQSHTAWLDRIAAWREQYPPKHYPADTPEVYQPQVIQAIHRATRGEAIVVADVGQHQMFAAQHYEYTQPYTFITSGGLGTMGYSLPAAIGAQMARPDKQVWCVVGDGCFQMTLQELAVIAAHRVPVKIALLNNEYLGMVRQQQQVQYKGNLVEVDLAAGGPDYIKLAQAYGIPAWRVTETSQLDAAIGAAMAYPGPAIIEFRVVAHRGRLPVGARRHVAGRGAARYPLRRACASACWPPPAQAPRMRATDEQTHPRSHRRRRPRRPQPRLEPVPPALVRDREPEHRAHQRARHHAPDHGRRRRAQRRRAGHQAALQSHRSAQGQRPDRRPAPGARAGADQSLVQSRAAARRSDADRRHLPRPDRRRRQRAR